MLAVLEFMILFLNFCSVCLGNTSVCTPLLTNFVNVKAFDNTLISSFSLWTKSGVEHSGSCAYMCEQDKECISFFYNARRDVCTAHFIQFYSQEPSIADIGSLYYTLPKDIRDCAEVLSNDSSSQSGLYVINPLDGVGPFRVYCDMTTDGGGWTVFQRRQDGSVDFFRNWADYKTGFGALTGEFWLGNDKISRLTAGRAAQLRIDMMDQSNQLGVANYTTFSVENEAGEYRMRVAGYSGTRGDSFSRQDNMKFTTKDRDNDLSEPVNCASQYQGAWWYKGCHKSNLNARYGDHHYGIGINWYSWHGFSYSLKKTEMKLRPAF